MADIQFQSLSAEDERDALAEAASLGGGERISWRKTYGSYERYALSWKVDMAGT